MKKIIIRKMFDGNKIERFNQTSGYEYFSLDMDSPNSFGYIYDKLNDTMQDVMIQIDRCDSQLKDSIIKL